MSQLNTELVNTLSRVKRPGTYYTHLQTDWHLPSIEIDGIGRLALPILPQQARQLLSVASQAPYGKGEETLVDTSVRNTRQIEAEQIHISGKHWQKMLNRLLKGIEATLGVQGKVTASLYKMLIYGEGSFFINHRDTEKEPGMFGSMIIALPSEYQGGELRLEHAGQEVTLDLRTDDFSEIALAAFYADCVHEVLPVTEGYRVVLAYNLCLATDKNAVNNLPKPPNYHAEQLELTGLLSGWAQTEHTGEDIPLKLVYLLEHAYTPDGLSFSSLKNGDSAIADVLTVAAEQADCDCYLALLSVDESGSAEYHGSYSRWGYDDNLDEDDFEIGEVFDEDRYLSNWQTTDQTTVDLGNLPFADEELCLPERLTTLEPDDLEFHEATGNAGASFERSYRRAVLVVWPRQYAADALATGGIDVSVPYLQSRVQQWAASAQIQDNKKWQEARQLAQAIIRYWPDAPEHYRSYAKSSAQQMLAAFLEPVIALRDVATIEMALRQIAITGKAYQDEDIPIVMCALDLLPVETAIPLLSELLESRAATSLSACARLLRDSLAVYSTDNKRGFLAAASALLDNLPEEKRTSAYYGSVVRLTAEQVADVLVAIGNVDEKLGISALATMLSRASVFPMDEVLIPAAIMLAAAKDKPLNLAGCLHQACLSYLDAEIAKPLEAPQNWAREANFSCGEKDNARLALKEFLTDPERQIWDYAAREQLRSNLAGIASAANADVIMQTIKRGSPHTLRFTKTQASYQRRVKQRAVDESNRSTLMKLNLTLP